MKLPVVARLVFVGLALVGGLGPWWAARHLAAESFPGFVVADAVEEPAAPFFTTDIVNPQSAEQKAHSAALSLRPDGSLVAVWYAGSGEGAGDVGIWQARRSPEGGWSAPRCIMSRQRVASELRRHIVSLGNPVLLDAPDGRLGLLFVSIAAGRWSGSSLNLSWSGDGGETWGPLRKLTTNPVANLSTLPRNPPSLLVGGGWAVPVYEEFIGRFPEILWLRPNGEDYGITRMAGGMSIFQPALVPLARGKALGFYREGMGAERAGRAISSDAGRTWTAEEKIALPNADAGLCVLRLPDGRLLAAFNDSTKLRDRQNLRLAVSNDEGSTWNRVATLAEESGEEFSYPYMITGPEGRVRMVYSSRRNRIAYAEFNTAWLAQQSEEQQ